VIDEVFDLLVALDADEEQLDFPILYATAKDGYAKWELEDENRDLKPLFEAILEYVPYPTGSKDTPTQAQVFTLDYDNFGGRNPEVARKFSNGNFFKKGWEEGIWFGFKAEWEEEEIKKVQVYPKLDRVLKGFGRRVEE